ncbi:hypothetical protein H0H93_010259 [Arthromyces matolae]|nr:hypothetical protein H0H93_010259 [Arthromyces matolae]
MGQVAFWRILKMTGGALVGATGWILLNPDTNYHKDDLPANLNVLIPVGKDDVWDNVMVLLGYQLAESRPIAVGMEDRASKCLVYKKGCAKEITITISRSVSILPVVLRSWSTAQMIMVTPFKISCAEGIAFGNRGAIPTQEELKRSDDRLIAWRLSTANWWRPCGEGCGEVWRTTLDGGKIGIWEWESASSEDKRLGFRDDPLVGAFKWRLGRYCVNRACKNRCWGDADDDDFYHADIYL